MSLDTTSRVDRDDEWTINVTMPDPVFDLDDFVYCRKGSVSEALRQLADDLHDAATFYGSVKHNGAVYNFVGSIDGIEFDWPEQPDIDLTPWLTANFDDEFSEEAQRVFEDAFASAYRESSWILEDDGESESVYAYREFDDGTRVEICRARDGTERHDQLPSALVEAWAPSGEETDVPDCIDDGEIDTALLLIDTASAINDDEDYAFDYEHAAYFSERVRRCLSQVESEVGEIRRLADDGGAR